MGKQKNYLLLVLKGCAMGAADVVPGVSGGTIAFITGIYEELIASIKSIDLQALKLLLSLKFADFWKKINGSFLLGVAGGIAISIFSLAKLMTWLLEHHPIYIWSFFFGLIVASSVLVAKEIKHWHIGTVISLIAGGCIAYVITVMSPAETPISVQQSVNVEGTGIAAALLRDCRLRAEIVIRNLGIEEVAILDRIPCQSDRSRKCLGADSLYGERRHGRLIVPAARNAARTGKEQQYFIYAFHRCSFSNS